MLTRRQGLLGLAIAFGVVSALPIGSWGRDAASVLTLLAIAALSWDAGTAFTLLLVYLPFRVMVQAMTPAPMAVLPDVVVFTLLVRLLILHRREILPFDPVEWLALAFGVLGIAVSVHAHAHLSAAALELRDLMLFVVLYAVVRRLIRAGVGPGLDFWRRVMPWALAAIAVVGLQGIVQTFVLGHDFLLPHKLALHLHVSATNRGRPYGWVDNPNTFGELGVIGLAILYARLRSERLEQILAWLPVAVLFAAMIVLSSSRTAYLVTLVLGTAFMAFNRMRVERVSVAAALVMMALAVLAVPGARARAIGSGHATAAVKSQARSRHVSSVVQTWILAAHGRGHKAGKASTQTQSIPVFSPRYFAKSAQAGRLHNLQIALQLARRKPLGTGLGTFGSSGSKAFGSTLKGIPKTFYADNNYIVVLVETGLMGTLIFVLLGVFLFRRIYLSPAPAAGKALTTALFVALTLMSVTGEAWEQFNLSAYPWIALALLIAAREPVAFRTAAGGKHEDMALSGC